MNDSFLNGEPYRISLGTPEKQYLPQSRTCSTGLDTLATPTRFTEMALYRKFLAPQTNLRKLTLKIRTRTF